MSDNAQARFGFVNFAETWNGRLAMLGFVIGLGTELLIHSFPYTKSVV